MVVKGKEKFLRNKVRIYIFIFLIFINLFFLYGNSVYAIDSSVWQETEYTKEYTNWLELSPEEKAKTIEPRKYEVKNTKAVNLFRAGRITRSALATEYDLRDYISENVLIRDQMQTSECWAFTGIAVLESNLALKDKQEGRDVISYDYSERHMDYSTVSTFSDGVNEYGFLNAGMWGNWQRAEMYLTSGRGAILEKDMPFENNTNIIGLSEIQNKTVQTKVEDTAYFESPPNNNTLSTEYKQWQRQIKEHIIKYGGVSTAIYMVDEYDSNPMGSYYCNIAENGTNHLVTIVGWNDEYSVDNFTGLAKPTNPGAWIIKNSWGDTGYTLEEAKKLFFELWPDTMQENGWDNPEDIANSYAISQLQHNGYTYDSEKGKYFNEDYRYKYDGYWYISYEDALVNNYLYGIQNSKTDVDYDNLYQHDVFGATYSIDTNKASIPGEEQKVYLANVFKKHTDTIERLNEVSIITNQTYTCKVYVNPNGISKAKEDLVEVKLETGEYETIDAGYHTLKFAEPIDIIGDNFVVIIEVENNDDTQELITVETEKSTSMVSTVTVKEGESYLARGNEFNSNTWIDAGSSLGANLCIKAFTTNGTESIRVATMPGKTEYIEGTSFESAGMVIMATIDNQEIEVTEYEVVNGMNLSLEQTSVTIKYEGKEVQVPITVIAKPQGSISNVQDLSKVYDGMAVTDPNFTRVGDGAVRIEWYKLESTVPEIIESAPVNAGIYKVKLIMEATNDYTGAEAEKTFRISKATPIYTKPIGLTAVEGETLADVELPQGFSWEQDLAIVVGQVGENTFTVKYTPEDIANYNEIAGIEVTIVVTEKPEIYLGKYIETKDEEIGVTYIENISPNTTIEELKNEIETNGTIEIYEGENKIEDENTKLATGMEVRITLENNQRISYKAVVRGDITGDGQINDADMLLLARYMVGFEREKQIVTGAKLRATDIVKDSIFATDGDLLKLAKVLVGLDNL